MKENLSLLSRDCTLLRNYNQQSEDKAPNITEDFLSLSYFPCSLATPRRFFFSLSFEFIFCRTNTCRILWYQKYLNSWKRVDSQPKGCLDSSENIRLKTTSKKDLKHSVQQKLVIQPKRCQYYGTTKIVVRRMFWFIIFCTSVDSIKKLNSWLD